MADFRDLYERIARWRDARATPSLHDDVLAPWLAAHAAHADWLRAFGDRAGDPVPHAMPEDLWSLYALSRVSDLLLRAQQDGDLAADDLTAFMAALGLQERHETKFTPVLHEIVEVVQAADATQPVTVAATLWPTLMLGPMVFRRAGVRVESGAQHVRQDVAETSTLFWTWSRANRPTLDLSMGWGSNSQWRTSFRRDYIFGDRAHLNVDATSQRPPSDEDLAPELARELLLHRCFVKSVVTTPAEDLWPYDQSATVAFP